MRVLFWHHYWLWRRPGKSSKQLVLQHFFSQNRRQSSGPFHRNPAQDQHICWCFCWCWNGPASWDQQHADSYPDRFGKTIDEALQPRRFSGPISKRSIQWLKTVANELSLPRQAENVSYRTMAVGIVALQIPQRMLGVEFEAHAIEAACAGLD